MRTYSSTDADTKYFHATAVSAGLCGIITDITLQLTPRQEIQGTEKTFNVALSGEYPAPVDLFGDAAPDLKIPQLPEYLRQSQNEYCRMMYWPQPYLPERLQVWQGVRVKPTGQTPVPYEGIKV